MSKYQKLQNSNPKDRQLFQTNSTHNKRRANTTLENNLRKIPILDDNLEDDLDDDAMSEILSQNDYVEKRPRSQMGTNLNEDSYVITKKFQNENQKLKQEIMKLKGEIFKTS